METIQLRHRRAALLICLSVLMPFFILTTTAFTKPEPAEIIFMENTVDNLLEAITAALKAIETADNHDGSADEIATLKKAEANWAKVIALFVIQRASDTMGEEHPQVRSS